MNNKQIKLDHNLVKSWKAAGDKHTDNYNLFKKNLVPILNDIQKEGPKTLWQIADELTKRKVLTRYGKTKWYPSQVRNYISKND